MHLESITTKKNPVSALDHMIKVRGKMCNIYRVDGHENKRKYL